MTNGTPILPFTSAQFVDGNGKLTLQGVDFLRKVVVKLQGQIDGLTVSDQHIADILSSLTGADGNLLDLSGLNVGELAAIAAVQEPGLMARDPLGQWFGRTATGTTGRVTVANGDGVSGDPTIDLATVTDAGGGTLLRLVRDAWGRITGTSTPTTTDLAEGTNLYFTASRVLATVLAGLSTATNAAITAADSVLVAMGKLQAQITALPLTASGTYTPTLTNVSNVASATAAAGAWSWLRVGNTVTVSGRLDVACTTAAGTTTQVGISLPVASNLTATGQLAGAGGVGYTTYATALILGDVTNDRATFAFQCAATASTAALLTFTYTVA